MGKGPGKSSSNKPQYPNANSPLIISWENFIKDRSIFPFFFSLGNVSIQLGENSGW